MPSSLFPQQVVPKVNTMNPATPQLLGAVQNMQMQMQPQMPQQAPNYQQQVLQLWNQVKNSSDPNAVYEQLKASNPSFKKVADIAESMGNPQQLFYTMAQQQGKDPNAVLNLLK